MAAIGTRYYTANPFEFDQNGVPLAGAQLFFYTTGTSTPQATYSDVNLTTPNTNPVIADANGRFGSVFLSSGTAYKVQLWTAPTPSNPTGVQIWSEDPCGPAAGGATSSTGIIGEVRAFAGPYTVIPTYWYLCYGQAISRTTYASAFAILGTNWGAGDGSTTFNVPDLRGRALFGRDGMGGVDANRVTTAVSGIGGGTLGSVGGSQLAQKDTITSNASTISTVTEAAHHHAQTIGQGSSGSDTTWSVTANGVSAASSLITGDSKTNLTVASATTVTSTSSLTGTTQNMPPAAIVNWIIFLGA